MPGSSSPPVTPAARLLGTSAVMKRLFDTVARVSAFRANVLILGESGTGKELIARALHARGPRRKRLFVPVSCATLGPDILENELFGHERGAFSGATEKKRGLFELADGGTLFLDEIAEMDLSTQAKLLRVLERSQFRRVGGTRKIKVDLSVIAATNKDLGAAIAAGRFRDDLLYRLKVVTLVVPPLRDHKEDIPILVDAFIADFNRRNRGKIRGIAPAALRVLMEHPWPGNVRELKNVVESASMLTDGDTLGLPSLDNALKALPSRTSPISPLASAPDEIRIRVGTRLEDVEKAVIAATVAHARSRAAAAQQLGIGARTLYTKLRQYGLS